VIIQIRCSVFQSKEGLYLVQSSGARLAVDDIARYDQGNRSAGVGRTYQRELTADPFRAFPHPLQTEVPGLAFANNRRLDAGSIVVDLQREVVSIVQVNV
jgi:hypothetical protein